MKQNVLRDRRILIFVAALFVSLAALLPAFMPRKAVATGETPVANWAELQTALADPATTGIVLTADVTIAAGAQINTSMADGLVIDGRDPNTGLIHTITERNVATMDGNLYINTNGTLKNITIRNLIINAKDYYGFPCVYNSVLGVNITYNNVTYTGPQITYNFYGTAEYNDCSITIVQNGATIVAQECAEVARVILGGTTTITSDSTGYTVFWLQGNYNNSATTPGFVQIKPNANIRITSKDTSRGLAYCSASTNCDLLIGSSASFYYNGNMFTTTSMFRNINVDDGTASRPTSVTITLPSTSATGINAMTRCAGDLTIGSACDFTVTGSPGTNDLIYVGGSLIVGDNSTLTATVNTAGGAGNFPGYGIYTGDSSGVGLTVGNNSKVVITLNGNYSGPGLFYQAGAGGLHSGSDSELLLEVTGASTGPGFYTADGDVQIGPSSKLSATFGGNASGYMLRFGASFKVDRNAQVVLTPKAANTTWAAYGSGTAGVFSLGQGASFLINTPGSGSTNRNGLYLSSNTGIQMADSASLKVYSSGNNSVDATVGNLIYLQNGSVTLGSDCTLEAVLTGANTGAYSGISARKGITVGANSRVKVDLNATSSYYGVYVTAGDVVVEDGATFDVHTAQNVTTRYYLLYLTAASSLTVNKGASMRLIAEDQVTTTTYATIYVGGAAGSTGLIFNSPESVVLYNGVGRSLVRYAAAAPFAINQVQHLNLWTTTPTWPSSMASGRFSPLPTYSWRSAATPNAGPVGATTVTGTIAAAGGAFSALSAPGIANTPVLASDQGADAPTATTFSMAPAKAAVVSFGFLPLTATYDNRVNPTLVSGTTKPGAAVILAKKNGPQYTQVGTVATADAQGAYAIDLQTLSNIEAKVDYAVITSDPATFLTTVITTQFFRVTFNANGGFNDPQLTDPYFVLKGSSIPAPPSPVNGLKGFSGWFTDEALTQPFAFDVTVINADLTLYAKWTYTSVVIHETVLGISGAPATDLDYALANLDPAEDLAFELEFISEGTGAVYHVLAWRDRPVTIDSLPSGGEFMVRARMVQHLLPNSIKMLSATDGASFTAKSLTTGLLRLEAGSRLELNFVNRIYPPGFGSAQGASNLYRIQGTD
ncbi:MAG: InlB B-repeat-containing protein [Actinomycetia bacterium]|nr:InlB B-repeat-containing protein [Actinomycetes bacterium]